MRLSTFTTFASTTTYTVPAGITRLMICGLDASGNPVNSGKVITVVPNTGYLVTIGATSSFGSLYQLNANPSGDTRLQIMWMDG